MASDWQLQTAKNKLSHVVDLASSRGPQTITRHGKPAAVLMSLADYRRLKRAGPGLAEFFAKSPLRGRRGLDFARGRDMGRDVDL